jgi:UDP-3-O-[3-hydroxymyristoyl] glucosamine N-acyltransferase
METSAKINGNGTSTRLAKPLTETERIKMLEDIFRWSPHTNGTHRKHGTRHPDAKIDESASVHWTASIGNSRIGPKAWIGPEVLVEDGAEVGEGTIVCERTSIRKGVSVPPADLILPGSDVSISKRS